VRLYGIFHFAGYLGSKTGSIIRIKNSFIALVFANKECVFGGNWCLTLNIGH